MTDAAKNTTTYGYDATGQLTQVTLPGGSTITYVYNAAGDRTEVIDGGTTTTYTSNADNEVTQVGSTTYTYDANGNLHTVTDSGGTTTYDYNDLNQLVSITAPDNTVTTFQYSPLGFLVGENVGGTQTNYLVDPTGGGNVVASYNGSGSLIADYTYGLGLVARPGPAARAITTSTRAATPSASPARAAAYVNQYSYLPFGETTTVSAALPNPFTFAGQLGVMQIGTNLFDMRARDYTPATGQFLSNDPIGCREGRPISASTPGTIRSRWSTLPASVSRPSPTAPSRGTAPPPTTATTRDLLRPPTTAPSRELPPPPTTAPTRERHPTLPVAAANDPSCYRSTTRASLTPFGGLTPYDGLIPRAGRRRADSLRWPDSQRRTDSSGLGLRRAHGGRLRAVVRPVLFPELLKTPAISPPGSPHGGGTAASTSSHDPNDLIGPAGYGSQGFFVPAGALTYGIEFENDGGVAAQDVTVDEPLSPNLDWSTFQLGSFSFGPIDVTVPAGLTQYQTAWRQRHVHDPAASPGRRARLGHMSVDRSRSRGRSLLCRPAAWKSASSYGVKARSGTSPIFIQVRPRSGRFLLETGVPWPMLARAALPTLRKGFPPSWIAPFVPSCPRPSRSRGGFCWRACMHRFRRESPPSPSPPSTPPPPSPSPPSTPPPPPPPPWARWGS